MSSNSSHFSRRGSRRTNFKSAEINVTPLVDVMLVLLIIFMVAAPMVTVGIPVDLPKTNGSQMEQNSEPLIVSLTKEGHIYIQETKVTLESLCQKLALISNQNKDLKIFVKGDKNLAYGKVVSLMGELHKAGFTKVSLITELP
jgi:biopolymer transport protein TolR